MEPTEYVARGAALLDEHRPGWEHEITLADLQIGSCHSCVGGQLYGRYDKAVSALGIGDDGYLYGMNWRPFEGPTRQQLEAAWEELILSRLLPADMASDSLIRTQSS